MSFLTPWGRTRRNTPATTFGGTSTDLWNQLDSAFEGLFNDGFFVQPTRSRTVGPQSYVVTDDTSHRISIALPGVPKDAVQVNIANGALTVGYEASGNSEDQAVAFATSFNKSWTLPDGVDTDNITAASNDGVLTITVPRTEATASAGRTITID